MLDELAEPRLAVSSTIDRARRTPRPVKVLAFLSSLTPLLAFPYLRGDGNGYYAWIRSPMIERDLDFRERVPRGDPAFIDAVSVNGTSTRHDHRDRRIRNQWGVGPAVVWTPFVVAGHGVARGSSRRASTGRRTGTPSRTCGSRRRVGRWPRRRACSSRTAWRSSLTLGPAVLGTVAIWLASPLPIYQYLLAVWPFGIAVGVSAALLWVWRRRGVDLRRLVPTRAALLASRSPSSRRDGVEPPAGRLSCSVSTAATAANGCERSGGSRSARSVAAAPADRRARRS